MKPAIWVAGLTGRNGGRPALDDAGFGMESGSRHES